MNTMLGRTPSPTTLVGYDQSNHLDVVCEVILADWFHSGTDTFDIRAFRSELEAHFTAANKPVPPQIADPTKLVPTLRLLQASFDRVKPTGSTRIEWEFIRGSDQP